MGSGSRGARCGLVLLALVCPLPLPASAPQSESDRVVDLLARYEHAEYPTVLENLDAPDGRERLRRYYEDAASTWIHAGGADLRPHRTLVAAALALDVAKDLKTTPREPWPGTALIVWAATLLKKYSPTVPPAAERWWYLSAIAELEAHDAWPVLGGTKGVMALQAWSPFHTLADRVGPGGLVGQARSRLPDEHRLALADAEDRERLTAYLFASFGTSILPNDTILASDVAAAERRAAAKVPNFGTAQGGPMPDASAAARDIAVADLKLSRLALVQQVSSDLGALAQFDDVRADAELHFGYLEVRLQAWPAAAAHLGLVADFTEDPHLLALAEVFLGWVEEHTGQPDLAMAAYRRGLALMPGARTPSWLLAGQLLMTGRADARGQAHEVLAGATDRPDTLAAYYAGDAARLPEYLDRMRAALH